MSCHYFLLYHKILINNLSNLKESIKYGKELFLWPSHFVKHLLVGWTDWFKVGRKYHFVSVMILKYPQEMKNRTRIICLFLTEPLLPLPLSSKTARIHSTRFMQAVWSYIIKLVILNICVCMSNLIHMVL